MEGRERLDGMEWREECRVDWRWSDGGGLEIGLSGGSGVGAVSGLPVCKMA